MDEDARAFVLHRWAETERLAMVALGFLSAFVLRRRRPAALQAALQD